MQSNNTGLQKIEFERFGSRSHRWPVASNGCSSEIAVVSENNPNSADESFGIPFTADCGDLQK